jgi:hypothetical protein
VPPSTGGVVTVKPSHAVLTPVPQYHAQAAGTWQQPGSTRSRSYTPLPCVAARILPMAGTTSRSLTIAWGIPSVKRFQVVPASRLT